MILSRAIAPAVAGLAMLALAGPVAAQDAAGDPAAGQRVFNQCRACHIVEDNGRNGVGPNLHTVFGRRAASIENFRYSANMRALGEQGHVWNADNLRAYLRNPKDVAPQGIMSFPGLRNEQQISDVIAFLRSQQG
ncbi:c-type cytochrome [Roseomonas rosulenta]|uniref:c-type cytochrome n=1 Tax=Roseomonas rosulenta TaxID=2748667 RepID=UPI0018DFC7F4|nr:cytochrome c family protein [Roseomonas rosulenta]